MARLESYGHYMPGNTSSNPTRILFTLKNSCCPETVLSFKRIATTFLQLKTFSHLKSLLITLTSTELNGESNSYVVCKSISYVIELSKYKYNNIRIMLFTVFSFNMKIIIMTMMHTN